jgi:hypothetical protein
MWITLFSIVATLALALSVAAVLVQQEETRGG